MEVYFAKKKLCQCSGNRSIHQKDTSAVIIGVPNCLPTHVFPQVVVDQNYAPVTFGVDRLVHTRITKSHAPPRGNLWCTPSHVLPVHHHCSDGVVCLSDIWCAPGVMHHEGASGVHPRMFRQWWWPKGREVGWPNGRYRRYFQLIQSHAHK